MKRNQVTTSSQIGSTKAMLLTLLVAALAAAMLSVTVWPGTSLKQRLSLAETPGSSSSTHTPARSICTLSRPQSHCSAICVAFVKK